MTIKWDSSEGGQNMGKGILNNKCIFCCDANPEVLIEAQDSSKVYDNNKPVLTTKSTCTVKNPMPCPRLTAEAGGTIVPCQMHLTGWSKVNDKIKINGLGILTDGSVNHCVHGGTIKKVQNSSNVYILNEIEMPQVNVGMENSSIERIDATGKDREKNEVLAVAVQNKDLSSDTEKTDNKKDNRNGYENPYSSYTLCDYRNCSKCNECSYYNAVSTVNNDSAKLRDNFKRDRLKEWDDYFNEKEKIEQKYENGGWNTAAHHIISGNQILLKKNEDSKEKDNLIYGSLVKLANFFGYDVNNDQNCILLPTNEKGFGDNELLEKNAIAYEVMSLCRRQWHVGGHKYSFDKDELNSMQQELDKNPLLKIKNRTGSVWASYVEIMQVELDKLLMKYSKVICWEEQKEKYRNKFIADMNGLSRRVEKELLKFKENPKSSYPYYVSKISAKYAFEIPDTKKVIFLTNENDHIIARKYRIMKRKGNMIINDNFPLFEVSNERRMEFVKYCENVQHFIMTKDLSYELPFKYSDDIGPFILTIEKKDKSEETCKMLYRESALITAFLQKYTGTNLSVKAVCDERMKGMNIDG